MRKSTIWRVALAILIVAVVVVRWAARSTPGGGTEVIDVSVAADLPDPEPGSRARVAPRAGASEDDVARATVTVEVETEPAGLEVTWVADLYTEPTLSAPRTLATSQRRRGTERLALRVPVGRFALHVHSEEAFGQTWTHLELSADDDRAVRVRLTAPGRLDGRVLAAGKPVAGARVLLAPVQPGDGRSGLPPGIAPHAPRAEHEATAETGPDGRYALAAIDPRTAYHGAATAPGFSVRREFGVRVAPGATGEMDFALEPGCRVTGRLLDAAGQPLAGAVLRAASARGDASSSVMWETEGEATAAADGRFLFDCLEPGWKKVQALLAAAPGRSVVGHWECRVARGDSADLGDLLVPDSQYEARIVSPDDEPYVPFVRFGFVPESGAGEGGAGALLALPVEPDDGGVVRVQGLPRGRLLVVVRDATARDDGRWRPETRIEEDFDGTVVRTEWMLEPLRTDAPDTRDAAGRELAQVHVALPETEELSLVMAWVAGELAAVQPANGAGLTLSVPVGERVRVLRTDGDRWGALERRVEETELTFPQFAADRPGNTLEVRVVDDGRPVPRALVLLGPVGDDEPDLLPLAPTDGDGRLVLRGVPPGVALCVAARVLRDVSRPEVVTWVAGRATVELDVRED